MNNNYRILSTLFTALGFGLLSACGGGGGGSSSQTPMTTQYTVTASAGAGGSITPATTSVVSGDTTTLTVTPSSGYVVDTVSGCGVSTPSGSTYTTGAITGNCTVVATFVAVYTVSATAGTGGTISPSSAQVNSGGTTTFTVTPASGYAIDTVTGCGASATATGTYTTGSITSNCTVSATFVAVYTVSATATAGGTISPSTAQVNSGGTATFTVTPSSGYVVNTVSGCGGSLSSSGGSFTTGAITADCPVTAQFTAVFTWMGGKDTVNDSGTYGIQGTPAAANLPSARDGAVGWTDSQGNLWLFGGELYNSVCSYCAYYNDLWKYSEASQQWTWVGGSQTADTPGAYGVQNVAAVSNLPGARYRAASWSDNSGNFWLFGGLGYDANGNVGYLNDLWEYSPASNKWTWVSGMSNTGTPGAYGTQNVAASTNAPGARYAATTWTDSQGNLWLFGGIGNDANGNVGFLSDLWEYSPASGKWTWVNGPDTADNPGVYGTQTIAAPTNMPGGRADAVGWADAKGNLWLFGGAGCDSTSTNCTLSAVGTGSINDLNDLWEYSESSGDWTWVSGSTTANAKGVYGTQNQATATNVPGARFGGNGWIDGAGNLWLFAGSGYDSNGTDDALNDLWEYSPASGQWTWEGGSNTVNASGTYGTQGTASINNMPGARYKALSWTDANGAVWLFGGYGLGSTASNAGDLNDLWVYPNP
jgi:N-acetylneuraminic acid mutarotase